MSTPSDGEFSESPLQAFKDSLTGRVARLRPANLDSPNAFSGDKHQRLERLVDEFGTLAAQRSLKEMGISLQMRLLWALEMAWNEGDAVPDRDAVTQVLEPSTGGEVMISIDPALAALVVERLLDVEPDVARPLRPVTATDRSVLRRFTELLSGCFQRLWEDASETVVDFGCDGFHKDLSTRTARQERVLVFALEAEIFGSLTVVHCFVTQSAFIPVQAAMLAPAPGPTSVSGDAKHGSSARAAIAEVPVDLCAEVASLRMSPKQMASLSVGDVIDLPGAKANLVALRADGVVVRRGQPGEAHGRVVVKLLEGPG